MSGKQSAYMNGHDYMRIRGYAQDDLELFLEEAKLSRVQFKTLKCQNDFVQGLTDYYHIIKRGRELHAIDNPVETEHNSHNHTVTYIDAKNNLIFEEKIFSCCDEVIKTAENSTIEGCTLVDISCRFMLKGLKPTASLLPTPHAAPTVIFTGIPSHTIGLNDLVDCRITFKDSKHVTLEIQYGRMTYRHAEEYALNFAGRSLPTCTEIFIHLSEELPEEESEERFIPALTTTPEQDPFSHAFIITYQHRGEQRQFKVTTHSSTEEHEMFELIADWVELVSVVKLPKVKPTAGEYKPAKTILLDLQALPDFVDALTHKTLSLGQLKQLEQDGYKFESYYGHFPWSYSELLRLAHGEEYAED